MLYSITILPLQFTEGQVQLFRILDRHHTPRESEVTGHVLSADNLLPVQ